MSKDGFEIPTMSHVSDTNVSDDEQTDAADEITGDPNTETGRL